VNRYCHDCHLDTHWPGECPKRLPLDANVKKVDKKIDAAVKRAKSKKRDAHVTVTPKSREKHCATCRCFPMTHAERQKAYRDRSKE